MLPMLKCDKCEVVLLSNIPMRCSRCRMVYYCSQACQKQHWKLHKTSCFAIDEIKGSYKPSIQEQYHNLFIDTVNNPDVDNNIPHDSTSSHHQAYCFRCLSTYEDSSYTWSSTWNRMKIAAQVIELIKNLYEQQESLDSSVYHDMKQRCYDRFNEEMDMFDKEVKKFHSAGILMRSELFFIELEYVKAIENTLAIVTSTMNDRGKTQIQLHLAKCYMEIEDYISAMKAYGKAIAYMTPDDDRRAAVLLGCSRCFYELGSYDKAIQSSEGAIIMNRHHIGAYKYLVKSYEKLQRYDMVIAWLKLAIRYETPWDDSNIAALKLELKNYEMMYNDANIIVRKVDSDKDDDNLHNKQAYGR